MVYVKVTDFFVDLHVPLISTLTELCIIHAEMIIFSQGTLGKSSG